MTRWNKVFARLDAISRTRALTESESMLLEFAIEQLDGKRNRAGTLLDEDEA